jgi:hypothetical protein
LKIKDSAVYSSVAAKYPRSLAGLKLKRASFYNLLVACRGRLYNPICFGAFYKFLEMVC